MFNLKTNWEKARYWNSPYSYSYMYFDDETSEESSLRFNCK